MVWLIGFLVAHTVEIAAIGTAAYAVNQVVQVTETAVTVVHDKTK